MIRIAFAIAVAVLAFTAVSGVSQAAPIAPLPAGVASEAASGNITHVWCRWGRCGYGWGWRRGWGPGYGWRGYGWGWRGGWCRWHPYRCGW